MRILLTGATSPIGAEVLKALLTRPEVSSVQLLERGDDAAALGTVADTSPNRDAGPSPYPALHAPQPPPARGAGTASSRSARPPCSMVEGEPELPRFGFSFSEWERFAASFDVGIHCAQRETQDQDLEQARRYNVLPVENWIALLERNPALRLHHLSTALTAGTRRGLYTEFDLECAQGFHNAYERSKYEAEVRLRESRVSDRVTVHRPSHGPWPLLSILASASVLPGDGRARIDFVPADYVASAITALAIANATGTFHLACGWHASLTVKQAAAIAAKASGRRRGATLLPRIVAPAVGQASKTARDLLHAGPVFDTYMADRTLPALGVHRPAPEAWLGQAVVQNARPSPYPSRRAAQPPIVRAESIVSRLSMNGAQFQRVGEVNLAYHIAGEGEPVVFLHGLTGAHAWEGVVERVAAQRRAIVIETLGIGDSESSRPGDYDPSSQAALVRGLLSRLDIASAHIVGNDIGGVIAQFFAVRWPHCVKSLVLSDCDAHGPWPPPHISWTAKLARLPIPIVARAALRRLMHDQRHLTSGRIERYRHTLAGSPEKRKRLRQLIRSLQRTDIASMNHLLSNLQVPTMIVWGADNAYGSTSWARTLYDSIPGARRLEIIPFAGISCHEEKPELFARTLTEFWEGQDR